MFRHRIRRERVGRHRLNFRQYGGIAVDGRRTGIYKTFHALVPRRQKRADKLSMRPVDKLSSATTSQPCSNKALTRLDPINPAAPVTTHRLLSFIGCLAP